MSSTVTPSAVHALSAVGEPVPVPLRDALRARLGDYAQLAKPRISVMVLVTVSVGYLLGSHGEWTFAPLLHALTGIALVAFASSALNQFIERRTDARMTRTSRRPLPAQRLHPMEALAFAALCGVAGTAQLVWRVNLTTAGLTLLTLVLYAFAYTPLKRSTSLCTAIGAIPGALPPVLGWAAAGAPLELEAFALFGILFLWQFPHFLAIAWMYQSQYEAAGLRMLPAASRTPGVVGGLAVVYALALIPMSLLPQYCGLAGEGYLLMAVLLGVAYLAASFRFAMRESRETARALLWTSLAYLPCLLLALTLDHVRGNELLMGWNAPWSELGRLWF